MASGGRLPVGRIAVVLVDPRTAGNIGAAARAMMNCGITDLRIVRGTRARRDAFRLAVHAASVVEKARVFGSLDEAVADAAIVVGFSHKAYRFAPALEDWAAALPFVRRRVEAGRVALVFGREDRGFDEEEARVFSRLCRLPSDAGYAVLNVAQAALLACHALAFGEAGAEEGVRPAGGTAPSREDLEDLVGRFRSLLVALGYAEPVRNNRTARILLRLRGMLERAGLAHEDIQLWRGLLGRTVGAVATPGPVRRRRTVRDPGRADGSARGRGP